MRSAALLLMLVTLIFGVTPVKVLEMEETDTRKFVFVYSAGEVDYSPYIAYQTGDSTDALIKIEIYHLDKGLVGTYNIPPSYENESLKRIYLGFTDGNEVPSFLYGREYWGSLSSSGDGKPNPPNSSYLLDDRLNVILTVTGVDVGISLFCAGRSAYAITGTNATPEKRTYYLLRENVSAIINSKNSSYSSVSPTVRFTGNGKVAHFSNLEGNADFEVFNVQGQLLHKAALRAKSLQATLPPIAAGTYIGRVKVEGGKTGVTPFIKN